MTALLGHSEESNWPEDVNSEVQDVCEAIRDEYSYKPGPNRRVGDDFKSITFGISYGGGQQVRVPYI